MSKLRWVQYEIIENEPDDDGRALPMYHASDYDELAARLAEAERLLDSGMIRLVQRDEFGQVGFCIFKGIDLRKCIAEAIEAERPTVSAAVDDRPT